MTDRLVLPAEEVMGMLRQGAEAAVYQKSPEGHVNGRRIKLTTVTIEYELEDVQQPWGLSGHLRILPKKTLTDPPLKRDDPRSPFDPAGGC